MDTTEFNKTAVRTETPNQITFDVRPFGARQGEAVDFYLHEIGMQLNYGTFSTSRPIVVLCDANTTFPSTTNTWLAQVNARGVPVSIGQK